ncbi:MAG: family 78 glycoside hydrolase catalytic domain, partial [Porphyromonadaceae bacterium]|nr:family 78 glycoside hydrolase catalytic domain [Porphyromonadaceae bacterium]
MRSVFFYILSFLLLFSSAPVHSRDKKIPVTITGLRTEGLISPLGIGTETPRFSWRLQSDEQNVRQISYHIVVASDSAKLATGKGDLWDSGIVKSDSSLWIPYQGKQLGSNCHAYWKVQVTAAYGKGELYNTPWSAPTKFSTGLFSENEWKGDWIGLDQAMPWDDESIHSRLSARYIRTEFAVEKKIQRATAFLSGLGLYVFYLNGKKVGNDVLTPAPTDYRRTVLYNTYDVTSLLQKENALGVVLGNGRFYTMRQNYKPYKINTFGYPKLRLNIVVEYTDGSREVIASNTQWKLMADGPIRGNNEYDGEIYDANKELGNWTMPGYDDFSWQNAQIVSTPSGTLQGAMLPGMKVWQELTPQNVIESQNGYILDFGQNMAGWVKMCIKGHKGDTIRLRFAERLTAENKALYTDNLRDALCTDTYICNGKENDAYWSPLFSYHGFRYVEVSGYPMNGENTRTDSLLLTARFMAQVISDNMEETGSFCSSNKMLNQIVQNARWGILSNYKGMPIDCPQRNERQPWLGDRTMGCWGESYLFENERLYTKWINDICEAQREDGCIPDVAPAFWNYYSDNITWPSALIFACDMVYTQFGNKEPIYRHYASMQKWVEHILEKYGDDSGIIQKDKYGDWCVPPESQEMIHSQDPSRITDGKLLSTAYFYKILKILSRFAQIQGLTADADGYDQRAERIKSAFNAKFLTVKRNTSLVPGHMLYPDSVYYGNNTVTANILPLAFDMIPDEYKDEVAKNVIASIIITHNAHVCCGVIGMQWLFRELCRIGRGDLAYLLATQESYPGYEYMVKHGATTIWELWNGDTASPKMNSGNHVMLLGDFLPFCYEKLGGIASSTTEVAFKHTVFSPDFRIEELDSVDVSYRTPYGLVRSRWEKDLTHVKWDIIVPPNTTGEVHFPDGTIQQIGSGHYQYTVEIPPTDKRITEDEFIYTQAPFPQCHAATIAETANGELITAFFGGTYERHPDVCIYVSRKGKGEKSWSTPVQVADGIQNDTLRYACWNPVLFQIPQGDLLLFYKVGPNVAGWTGYLMRSSDEGKTWSVPEQMPEGFLGAIKNKPLYNNGRIISPSSTEGKGGWRIHFEMSDDQGKTWRKTAPVETDSSLLTSDRGKEGAELKPIYSIQPAILKLADGRLMALCRTRNAKIAVTYSDDNGDTWS